MKFAGCFVVLRGALFHLSGMEYGARDGGNEMKRVVLSVMLLCLFASGCGSEEDAVRIEAYAAPEEAAEHMQEAPAQEKPVIEIEPVVFSKPELRDPLWNSMMTAAYSRDIVRTEDQVTVFETDAASDLKLRLYQMENGDRVTMGRRQNAMGEIPAYVWELPGDVLVRWYDRSAGQWLQDSLSPGEIRHSMVELTLENGGSFLIYLPKTYRLLENEVLEYLPEHDGTLTAAKVGEKWRLTLLSSLPDQGCVSDFTMVQGPRPMLDWSHPYCGELWKNYTMDTEGKWCFDGY